VVQQLEKEVNQLKEEVKELKAERDNSPEYQSYLSKKEAELQNKQQKLEQLRDITKTNDNEDKSKSDNKFPTVWVIGGGVLLVITGMIGVLIARSKRKRK
jgi:hypothetical protein